MTTSSVAEHSRPRTTVSGLPNLFLVNGPNGFSGHTSGRNGVDRR